MSAYQSRITFLSGAFFFFCIVAEFIPGQFPLYPLLQNGDIIDFFHAFTMVLAYYLLIFDKESEFNISILRQFIMGAVIMVTGHAMHLPTNAIGHLMDNMQATDAYKLDYFFDEIFSHYVWTTGFLWLLA